MRRPPADEIPDAPGAYLFRDSHGAVLYVGKAKSLRKRVANYFGRELLPRTELMVEAADSLDTIVTDNEVEAVMLEYSLIQKHKPRFNIRLRDDKSYPYLALTMTEPWPRATVMRGKRHRGNRYFGPYAHAYAIRQTLDLLLRTFPVRTCTNEKFKHHVAQGRPCLLFHIERCAGPCIGAVSPEDYARHLEGLADFLSGRSEGLIDDLRSEMNRAAEALEYERAARVRDRLAAVERALERQEVASQRREDFDVIAIEEDDLEAALVLLAIRHGRVTGRATAVVDKVEDVTTPGLVARMLQLTYGDEVPPPEVLVQELPEDPEVWREWLAVRRGSEVDVRVPRRGSKVRLLETARTNAKEEFARHRLRRAGDHNARARALRSIQEELDLPEPPLRIEAFDISTIQGSHTVGSMVVMEDGLPKRSQYRRFEVRSVAGQDDFAAMEEVLTRRFRAYLEERQRPVEERGRFAYPPSLLLVDGGAGQLGRAVKVVSELGIDIPVAGLAKRMEEVYLPGRPDPVRIPRGRDALYLLQQIRDEAHRFAIGYHRTLRGKAMIDSVLDAVPGLGPVRRRALLKMFGSLKRMREATIEELAEVIPAAVARNLHDALHGGGGKVMAPDQGGAGGTVVGSRRVEMALRKRKANRPHLVIISGMSGAGRSAASKALEDAGFFVIDNLPADLISEVVARSDLREGRRRRLAVVVDTRGGLDFGDLETVMRRLGGDGVVTTLLFLDADDEVLARRFEETRRPHPVPGETVADSIAAEREALRDLRGRADVIIDTTDRNVHELRQAVIEAFAGATEHRPLKITFTSFGFKHGVPRVVDLLFDARFLANPHWEEHLRALTGLDGQVRDFVLSDPDAVRFVDMASELLTFLVPKYAEEGKAYLTVAVGCTGGRHRSVVIAEELAARLRDVPGIEVATRHRDLGR